MPILRPSGAAMVFYRPPRLLASITIALFAATLPSISLSAEGSETANNQPARPSSLNSQLSTQRPNIILIMADDLGAECLSCYGSLDDETPRLDALAKGGARFTHAHSQPLCTPSRVQIMTGKYNFRNYDDFGYLDPEETTFADMFRESGYRTAIAGKWQLSGQTRQHPRYTDPADWGFDEHCLWQLNNRAPYGDRGPRYWNPYLEKNGEVIRPGENAYGPDVCAEFLIDFMTRHQDEPFLVYYPMILTHSPFLPTPDSNRSLPRDKKNVRNFRDMVAYMDAIVGRIVDHVASLGLTKDTVIIFAGDNGTSGKVTTRTTDGKIRGDKGSTTTAGTHVPLIVRWPGRVPAGATDDRLIDFTDVLPSLLAAAGIEPPKEASLDGVPFLDAAGLSEPGRSAIYCWYEPRHSQRMAHRNAIFARNHDYKLYADGRFFHVAKTPRQRESDLLKPPLSAEETNARGKLQAVLDHYAGEIAHSLVD